MGYLNMNVPKWHLRKVVISDRTGVYAKGLLFIFLFFKIFYCISTDILGAIQKCQHFHECTNSTPFRVPLLPLFQVYRPTFWSSKTRSHASQLYNATTKINPSSKPAVWQIISLAMVCTLVKMLTVMDGPLLDIYSGNLEAIAFLYGWLLSWYGNVTGELPFTLQ